MDGRVCARLEGGRERHDFLVEHFLQLGFCELLLVEVKLEVLRVQRVGGRLVFRVVVGGEVRVVEALLYCCALLRIEGECALKEVDRLG